MFRGKSQNTVGSSGIATWLLPVFSVIVCLFLTEVQATMDDITFRSVPNCLPASRTLSYGWNAPEGEDTSLVQRKVYPTLTLEYSAWSSSNLTTYVVAYLLRDVMGIPIRMAESSGQTNTYERIAEGVTHLYTEIWPLTRVPEFRKYIIEEAKIDYMGLLGYAGRIALYFPRFIIDSHPDTIFTSWRSLLQPDVLQYLPMKGTTPTERLPSGEFMCTKRYCTNGIYVPPQCMPNGAWFGRCRELWHVTPDYSIGINEQRIFDLGLPLVVVYLGPRFLPLVEQCLQRQDTTRTCLFFYWTPETLIGMYPVERVNFDPPRPGSWASWNSALAVGSDVKLTVDWDTDLLHKIAHKSVRETVPPAWLLFRSVSFTDSDILQMLASITSTGKLDVTACEWVKMNEAVWKAWVPPPPPDLVSRYAPLLPPNQVSIVLHAIYGVLLVQLVITSIALYLFRRDAKVRIQSPILLSAVLAGAFIQSTAAMLKQWAPSNCSVAPHFIAIGWSLVQVAILLKVWRTYFIFFNLRISTVVYGRLFTLKVTTKHLLATGAVLFVALLGNVIIKFLMSPLTPEMRALSTTQFTNACTMRVSVLGIFGEWSWVMFQLHIAGGALWMSQKTKGVVSLYNEHGPVTYSTLCQTAVLAALNLLTVLGEAVDPHVLVTVTTLLILLGSIGSVAVLATTTVVPISTWSAISEVLSALAQGNVQQVRTQLSRLNSRLVSVGGRSQQQGASQGDGAGGRAAPGAVTMMLDQTGSMSADLDDGFTDVHATRGGATLTRSGVGAASATGQVGAESAVAGAGSPAVTSGMSAAYDCAGSFSPEELRSMSTMAVPLSGALNVLKPKEMLVAHVTVHVSSNVSMRQLPRHRWSLQQPHWLPVKLVTFADVPLFFALPVVSKSVMLRGQDCRGIVHRGANTQTQVSLLDASSDSTLCPLRNSGAALLQLGPKSTQPTRNSEAKDDGILSWLIHMNDAESVVPWIATLTAAFLGTESQLPARAYPNSRTSVGKTGGARQKPVHRAPSLKSSTDPSSPLVAKRGSVGEQSTAGSANSSLARSSTPGSMPDSNSKLVM